MSLTSADPLLDLNAVHRVERHTQINTLKPEMDSWQAAWSQGGLPECVDAGLRSSSLAQLIISLPVVARERQQLQRLQLALFSSINIISHSGTE